MKTIKFSHKYSKLLNRTQDVISKAVLLYVQLVSFTDLSEKFLDYETDYGKYRFPENARSLKFLMLIFLKRDSTILEKSEDISSDRNLFTTLRRFTPKKYAYYSDSIGEEFEIEIREPQ